jgi:site-specific recombinase XerD
MMTNEDLFQSYIGSLYGYSSSTIETHVASLTKGQNSFLNYARNFDIVDTTIKNVEDYKEFLLQRFSLRSVQKYLCCLRKFFKFLRVQGYIKSNPALEVVLPIQSVPQEYKVVCPEVVEKLLTEDFGLNNFSTVRNRLLICFILRCGLHAHEI